MTETDIDQWRLDGWCLPIILFAFAWFLLLSSGYNLGQLFYGVMVFTSPAPDGADIGRTLASAGVSLLTIIPARIGGIAGAAGCVGLLMRQSWACIALVVAAVLLAWPILVWFVALVFWQAFDPVGSALLLVHLVITALVAVGAPILATRVKRLAPGA